MTLSVWQFEPGMTASAVTSGGERDVVITICELDKVVHKGVFWYDPTFRCPVCIEKHDPEATCVITDDYALIPCYSCESVIRRPFREW